MIPKISPRLSSLMLTALLSVPAALMAQTTPVIVLNPAEFTKHATVTTTLETFTYEVPEAPDRKLVVTYHNKPTTNPTVVSGITYGGQALTQAAAAGSTQMAQIWYLDDPVVGTASLQITQSVGDTNGFRISVSTLANAADGVSVTTQGTQVNTTSITSTYNLNATTVSDDTILFAAFNGDGTGAITTEPYPSTQRLAFGISGASYASAGYTQVETPSLVTNTWVRGVSGRAQVGVLAGFAAAGELPEITNTPITVWNTANNFENSGTSSTNTISDFEIGLNSYRKLVVTIVGENTGGATGVTYGGLPLTLAIREQDNAEVWYLDNPPVGTADIIATFGNITNSRMGAISLVGAAPGVDATGNASGSSLVNANLDITRVSTNATVVGAYYSDDDTVAISSSPTWSNIVMEGDAGSSNSNAGLKTFIYPGLSTLTWVNASPATFRAVAASFAPAAGFTAPANPGLSSFRIPAITVPPTIDGILSPSEWGDAYELPMIYPDLTIFPNIGALSTTSNNGSGSPTTAADATESDISARVFFKWNAEFLYIALDVKDDIFIVPPIVEGTPLGDVSPFPNDHILLSIDPDITVDPATSAIFVAEFFLGSDGRSNYNFRDDLSQVNLGLGSFTNHQYAASQVTGGYVIEVALRWTDITGDTAYKAIAGKKFGAAVLLIDNDADDGGRDVFLRSTSSSTDQTTFHEVTLDATGSYDKWILGFAGVGVDIGKSENPDGDAYTNEQEWLLGSNPSVLTNSSDFEPTVGVNAGLLEYTYDRRKNAAELGISYDVQVSLDLSAFDVIDPTYTPDPTPTSLDNEFEMVTDSVELDQQRKFLRLNITGPAE